MIDAYDWAGGREGMLRLGPDDAPVVIVALPPFEEANRTRTFAVTTMRALAERGVASALPDLPGTNDSLIATEDATLAAWRTAFAAAAEATGAVTSVAIRGGALIDTEAALAGHWHLAPQTSAMLVRELTRIHDAGGGNSDETVIEIAGNRLSRHLLGELGAAIVSRDRVRTVRLTNDAQPADVKIDGSPLWRRAEPDNDPALAALLADDIVAWVRTCAG
ncbi:MAG: hypothetical protein V4537_05850 [Pseudomonadota bacterium]